MEIFAFEYDFMSWGHIRGYESVPGYYLKKVSEMKKWKRCKNLHLSKGTIWIHEFLEIWGYMRNFESVPRSWDMLDSIFLLVSNWMFLMFCTYVRFSVDWLNLGVQEKYLVKYVHLNIQGCIRNCECVPKNIQIDLNIVHFSLLILKH